MTDPDPAQAIAELMGSESFVRKCAGPGVSSKMTPTMFVKICGITRSWTRSTPCSRARRRSGSCSGRRARERLAPSGRAEIIAALPSQVTTVGVFVNEPIERIRAMA